QDRTELAVEAQHAGSDEVRERCQRLVEALHVGEKARPLDREDEVLGRQLGPAPERIGALHAVERAVDLDRGEHRADMRKLALVRQSLAIEATAPGLVGPARKADADVTRTLPAQRGHAQRTWAPGRGCLAGSDRSRAGAAVEREPQDLRQFAAMERLVEQQ